MLRAIILSAGQGKRLLPLTSDRPKCLVELNGKSVLEWQLTNLLSSGINYITIVTGFKSQMVEELILNKFSNYNIECFLIHSIPFQTIWRLAGW